MLFQFCLYVCLGFSSFFFACLYIFLIKKNYLFCLFVCFLGYLLSVKLYIVWVSDITDYGVLIFSLLNPVAPVGLIR